MVRPSADQQAPEKKFDAITNAKLPEIFQCLCQQLNSVKSIFIKKKSERPVDALAVKKGELLTQ